jgi:hypothetical protein
LEFAASALEGRIVVLDLLFELTECADGEAFLGGGSFDGQAAVALHIAIYGYVLLDLIRRNLVVVLIIRVLREGLVREPQGEVRSTYCGFGGGRREDSGGQKWEAGAHSHGDHEKTQRAQKMTSGWVVHRPLRIILTLGEKSEKGGGAIAFGDSMLKFKAACPREQTLGAQY